MTYNVQVVAGFPFLLSKLISHVRSRFYHVVIFKIALHSPAQKNTLTPVKSVDVKIVPKLLPFLDLSSLYFLIC